MPSLQRRTRFGYTMSLLFVLWLGVAGTVGVNFLLEAKGVSNAGALATLMMFLPSLYAFGTFRVVYAFSRYRERLRTTNS